MIRNKTVIGLVTGLAMIAAVVPGFAADEGLKSLAIGIGGVSVDDNSGLHAEHQWKEDGLVAGVEEIVFESGPISIEAQALVGELAGDYDVSAIWAINDSLALEFEFEMFSKIFDDVGGFYGDWPSYSLDEDLVLDIGNVGLALVFDDEDNPLSGSVSYDYAFKDGEKSLLEWNSVTAADGMRKYIYPAMKTIDEQVHTISLNARYEDNGLTVEDTLALEIYDLETSRSDLVPADLSGGTAEPQGHPVSVDGADYDQIVNTLTAEKWISDELLITAGYMYLTQDGESQFRMAYAPNNKPGTPIAWSGHGKHYFTEGLPFDQESHTLNASALYLPCDTVVISLGIQGEATVEESDGPANRKHGNPPVDHEVHLDSEYDQVVLSENIEIRYLGIPKSTIYAQASLKQDGYDLVEHQTDHDGAQELARDTEADIDQTDYRVGFSTTPCRQFTLNSYYRMKDSDGDYTHKRDEDAIEGELGTGYSALITGMDKDGEEIVARVSLRPCDWLSLAAKYKHATSDRMMTIGQDPSTGVAAGTAESMDHESDTMSLSAVIAPTEKLTLTAVLAQSDSKTVIPAVTAPGLLDDYQADVTSLFSTARYAVNEKTDVAVDYQFSTAENIQMNSDGVPAGTDYEQHVIGTAVSHEFSDECSAKLRYELASYRDNNYADEGEDYTAHGLFASMRKAF